MIAKLPRWVWGGAWALACVAGMVNVVGLLGFQHQAVTHLTGTTSMLGAAIASLDFEGIRHLLVMIGSFVLGTAISGFVIEDGALRLGRHYGTALLMESALLFAAVPLLHRQIPVGDYLASCACGIQNAMATTFSGSVVRTTHLSGMFTDLGISVGHWLRGLPVERLRLRLSLIIITGFLAGGILGALLFDVWGYNALLFPAAFTGACALFYVITEFLRIHREKGPGSARPDP